jgi:ATP-binding cassette subfamily B protein
MGELVERLRHAKALLILLWRADRHLVIWMALLTVALGVLPNATILATGMLVAALPDAVHDGLDSSAGRAALLGLVLVTLGFFASGVGLAVARLLCELMNTRLMQVVSVTAGRACLAPRLISELDDPVVAGELDAVRDFERTGLFLQTSWALRIFVSMRVAGAGAAVILLPFAWWAPVVLVCGWLVANSGSSRWLERGFVAARTEGGGRLRRAEYLRGLALGPDAAKELRVFGLAEWLTGQYAATWLQAMSAIWRARRTNIRALALGTGAIVTSHAVVLGALTWEAVQGRLSVGALTVYGLAALGTSELGFLGEPHWRVARSAALAHQLLDLEKRLGVRPSPPNGARFRAGVAHCVERAARDDTPPSDVATGPVDVRLEGVTFGYRTGGPPVLANLDLHIPAGQSVAIVGANGAGKTTVIKLVCGLYEPTAGRVLLDGRDIRTLDVAEVSARVSVIFQSFVRYELPLRENIGFGSLPLLPHEDRLADALRAAGGADLLAELPRGWDTVLARGYPGGVDLSGGQWQKVALARALAAVRGDAGLLILDEPTVSLDVRAEVDLFERFLDLTRDITTILVSHRLWSVRHVDRIVVLADGRVVEDGDHDTLMALGGRYATMFRLQAERFDGHQVHAGVTALGPATGEDVRVDRSAAGMTADGRWASHG